MKKSTIQAIMDKNLIASEDEARACIEFVRDLIEAEVERLEEDEPYATKTISRMKECNMFDISSLLDGLDE